MKALVLPDHAVAHQPDPRDSSGKEETDDVWSSLLSLRRLLRGRVLSRWVRLDNLGFCPGLRFDLPEMGFDQRHDIPRLA